MQLLVLTTNLCKADETGDQAGVPHTQQGADSAPAAAGAGLPCKRLDGIQDLPDVQQGGS